MTTGIKTTDSIYYGEFTAEYGIVKDKTPLSQFYQVRVRILYKTQLIIDDSLPLIIKLHLAQGYYSDELVDYTIALQKSVERYVWTHLLEVSYLTKGLLIKQSQVLVDRVGSNLLEKLYPTGPS